MGILSRIRSVLVKPKPYPVKFCVLSPDGLKLLTRTAAEKKETPAGTAIR
jgi:hypothetical protein